MQLYSKMQRYLYTFCYYLAVPVLLLRLLWRSRANVDYRHRWAERFGYVPYLSTGQATIWLHAVSVGETLAAVPLIKALLESYPQHRVVITSTTPTGSSLVKKHFSDQVVNVYLPFDLPDCMLRFLNYLKPQLGIIMETELWPNLLHACQQAGVPLLLANARLSQKSMQGYQKIAALTASMLSCFTLVASQAPSDGERFVKLGLPQQCLLVTGNIKFDIQLPQNLVEQGQALRLSWGASRPILVAASTHAGEDEIVLSAFTQLRLTLPQLLLVLVPRHPERFDTVVQLCEQHKYQVARRSRNETVAPETAILVGDTMGELLLFYAAADVAFVGGSFVAVGGHNLIEPAILGVPVLTGPYLHNFVDISQLLLGTQAAQIVKDSSELAEFASQLLVNEKQRQQMGQRGRDVILANRGALKQHLQCISQQIKSNSS